MKRSSLRLRVTFGIAFGWVASSMGAIAQIVPDGTLPSNSVVNVEGQLQRITGGTTAGGNLFHSFREFSVPTGGTAHFDNAPDIQNILTRVTGRSISNIDGLLQANGTANLFLINPNGIIFGPNARLNVGGSFIGSSANSIKFADGTEFSASNPQTTPLLTVTVPIGLQVGPNPGAIRVQGLGNLVESDPETFATIGVAGEGLQVESDRTLALVGGEVVLERGNLTAPGGRVELGSVAEGMVTLTPTISGYSLSLAGVENFQDIRLIGGAAINTTGATGGGVQLQGRRVALEDGSVVVATSLEGGSGGSVAIAASESVEFRGTNPIDGFPSVAIAETTGTATGGDIVITTERLILQDGGQASASTYGSGNAGNIIVNAASSVEMTGAPAESEIVTGLFTAAAAGTGNAGTLTVNTGTLTLRDGAQISSATFDEGRGGDVSLNASDSVELIGTSVDGRFPSLVSNTAFGSGDAGSLTINTGTLRLRDGAQVVTGTLGSGRGGNLRAIATESTELIGTSADFRTGLFASAIQDTGDGGNLTIVTDRLIVRDGAQVSASNFHSRNLLPPGSGAAGNIEIVARSIRLDSGGTLTAAANAGDKGNIILRSKDIQLRRGSAVTTNASGPATGGNIAIDTDTLAALENSDITANAVESFGGRVSINTRGIFGTEFRQLITPASDITATSALGAQFSGTVEISTPDVDPSSGLVDLSVKVVDVTALISRDLCELAQKGSSFVVTGRGGLPPNPSDPLASAAVVVEWANRDAREPGSKGARVSSPLQNPQAEIRNSIVEATGFSVAPDGTVILTVRSPQIAPSAPVLTHPGCRDFNL